MKITKTSTLTGITRTLDIDVTPDQIIAWEQGQLIQNVMPHLSADEREFLMTGITSDEWDAEFGEEEEGYPGEDAIAEAEEHFAQEKGPDLPFGCV